MTASVSSLRLLEVRPACARVAATAAHVHIDGDAVLRLAADLAAHPVAVPAWGEPHLVAAAAETVAGWTLLLSALNFCFWQDEPRWRVEGHDGYMALAHALRRAHDARIPVSQPAWYASWTVDELRTVLRGDSGTWPPLLAERHAVSTELGRWIVAAHRGSALHTLAATPSAYAFAQELAATLRGFRDVEHHRGFAVPLLKRAQIAAHDCGAALGDAAPAGLHDRSELTAFADYKLPQVLRAAGVLVYTAALAHAVDTRTPLRAGCEEEVEIRACTVVAVDALAEALRARGTVCDAPGVDAMLWWRGQELRDAAAPYHRVRTIWY